MAIHEFHEIVIEFFEEGNNRYIGDRKMDLIFNFFQKCYYDFLLDKFLNKKNKVLSILASIVFHDQFYANIIEYDVEVL